MHLVFAETPEPALPSLQRLIDSPRRDVGAVLTRLDAAAAVAGADWLHVEVMDNYFGRTDIELPWEQLNKVEELKNAV